MIGTSRGLAALALSFSVSLGAASPALAAGPASAPAKSGPKDKAALKLDAEAMGKDYLETAFIKAERKLQQAITLCGAKGCSPKVLAQLHRDLGVVRISGLGNEDAGKEELAAAFELDPELQLDADYATPAMKKAYDEVRRAKLGPSKEEASIAHEAVPEQAVGFPVPVYATLSGGQELTLRVSYKGPRASKWSSVTMSKQGEGFSAEIPCSATGAEGDVEYFLEAFGEDGESVAREGSRKEPHVVHVRKSLEGDAPHLPGAAAPDRCKDTACTGDDCDKPPNPDEKRDRNNWFVFSVEQDFTLVGEGVGVCSFDVQVNGEYNCFRQSGSQYHGNPVAGDPADNVAGGIGPATTRLHVGYDRVLAAGLVLGLRFGVVLRGGGPRADGADVHPFLPIHAEGRLAYWFGKDVFSTSGFRPFIFAAGGAAQVDTAFSVAVREDKSKPPPAAQPDNPSHQTLDAYRRMGQGFAGGGAGLMYAFTPGAGLVLGAKFMRMFPTGGNVLAPELGFALGF
jgi:hypothetical protein